MTKQQEFRKQTEEAKFEAFSLMCKKVTELEAEVKEWKDKADLWCKTANLKDHNIMINKELEKENAELKTKKIPQLERRIASIRGSHRVDVKKLNARIEQVERLKKENAELTKAKEIIKELLNSCFGYSSKTVNYEVKVNAEQFLKDNA